MSREMPREHSQLPISFSVWVLQTVLIGLARTLRGTLKYNTRGVTSTINTALA